MTAHLLGNVSIFLLLIIFASIKKGSPDYLCECFLMNSNFKFDMRKFKVSSWIFPDIQYKIVIVKYTEIITREDYTLEEGIKVVH